MATEPAPASQEASAEARDWRAEVTEQEWWDAAAPALERVYDAAALPLATRIGQAAGEANQSAHEPDHGLAFGLERILDGIAALIATRPA